MVLESQGNSSLKSTSFPEQRSAAWEFYRQRLQLQHHTKLVAIPLRTNMQVSATITTVLLITILGSFLSPQQAPSMC